SLYSTAPSLQAVASNAEPAVLIAHDTGLVRVNSFILKRVNAAALFKIGKDGAASLIEDLKRKGWRTCENLIDICDLWFDPSNDDLSYFGLHVAMTGRVGLRVCRRPIRPIYLSSRGKEWRGASRPFSMSLVSLRVRHIENPWHQHLGHYRKSNVPGHVQGRSRLLAHGQYPVRTYITTVLIVTVFVAITIPDKNDAATFRLFLTTADGSVRFIAREGVEWSREEALADIVEAEFLDLPERHLYTQDHDELGECARAIERDGVEWECQERVYASGDDGIYLYGRGP
ncbi:hypothetical protein BC936DRAFT_144230, partial [Jimgerdemannia flammicorona]